MKVDRIGFIQFAKRVADGRKLIFKLHPNEDIYRAKREIQAIIPEALIFTNGNVQHMIANCNILITVYSSVIFTALALGKEITVNFDLEKLLQLTPIQNGGASAHNISEVFKQLLTQPVEKKLKMFWPISQMEKSSPLSYDRRDVSFNFTFGLSNN